VVLRCDKNGWGVRDSFHALKITKREVDLHALSGKKIKMDMANLALALDKNTSPNVFADLN
jgi:hypothetical protein